MQLRIRSCMEIENTAAGRAGAAPNKHERLIDAIAQSGWYLWCEATEIIRAGQQPKSEPQRVPAVSRVLRFGERDIGPGPCRHVRWRTARRQHQDGNERE